MPPRMGPPTEPIRYRLIVSLLLAPASRAAGDRRDQARTANSIGWFHSVLGEHQESLSWCRTALATFEELGDDRGQAHTQDSVGHALHHLGDHAGAVRCYLTAVRLFASIGERFGMADTLDHLGDAELERGRRAAAREAWERSSIILEDLDHDRALEVRTKLAKLAGTPRPAH